MAATALNTFLHGLVDYAGLFPPSQLPMEKAVAEFARLKKSSHAAGVARFIVPLSRLDEWSEAARPYLLNGCVPDNQPAPAPWGLSVLLDGP
ncbi:MAG TPA: hypothetical protein VFF65_08485, partial [Phycisphaerales bacterium]|nr:hypothetical protein [Phycisphaerales bacterium]